MARTRQHGRLAGRGGVRPPLHDACFWGDLEEVKRLLSRPGESGYGGDKDDGAGDMTPLHWACLRGRTDVVRELRCHFVAKGGLSAWKTAVETRNGGGCSPLELAENKETVRYLLGEGGADALNGGGAQLAKFCHSGDTELFRVMLDAARKIENERGEDGRDAVKRLVNYSGREGNRTWTPLRCACWEGHFGMAKMLLEHGADWNEDVSTHKTAVVSTAGSPPLKFSIDALPKNRPDLTDKYGNIGNCEEALRFVDFIVQQEALYEQLADAIQKKAFDEAATLLQTGGALPNSLSRGNKRQSPLSLAVTQKNIEFARSLVDKYGADVNVGGGYNDAPLVEVTNNPKGQWEMFQLLMQSKDIHVDKDGCGGCYTPLHLACKNGQINMAIALLKKGADVHMKTDDSNGGCPPIHFACRWTEDEDADQQQEGGIDSNEIPCIKAKMIELLLENGSDPNALEFDDDRTPLLLLAGSWYRSHKNHGKGEVQAAELLLKHGADVNFREGSQDEDDYGGEDIELDGHTPLSIAIDRCNYDIAELLITEGGADVNILSHRMHGGRTHLHALCWQPVDWFKPRRKCLDLIRLLVEKGGDPDTLNARGDTEGRTPLHDACCAGNYRVAKLLLSLGANPFLKTDNEETCLDLAQSPQENPQDFADCLNRTLELIRACQEGDMEHIKSIFRAKPLHLFPQVKIPGSGQYLLHYLCHFGLLEATKRLVAKGADIKVRRDGDNKTPLDLAEESGHEDIVQWFQKQLNQNAPLLHSLMIQEEINNCLFDVMEEGNEERGCNLSLVKDLIVNAGADVNCQNKYCGKQTPLHIASAYGDMEVTKLLIEHSANVNVKDVHLLTPLHASILGRCSAVTELLLVNGANALVLDEYGNTPLHIASSCHLKRMSKLLLAHGADILAQNQSKKTPEDCARQRCAQYGQAAIWTNTSSLVKAAKEQNTTELVIDKWKGRDIFGQTKIYASNNNQDVSWSDAINKSVKFVMACQQGRLEATEGFVRLNIFDQTEELETEGEFLLHAFCRTGNILLAQYLVQSCGAQVKSQRNDGMTPLALAAKHGHTNIIEWFLEGNFNEVLDLPDNWGNTPLHHACREGHLEIVKLFLESNGRELCMKQNWLLQTPYDSAVAQDHLDVARICRSFQGHLGS